MKRGHGTLDVVLRCLLAALVAGVALQVAASRAPAEASSTPIPTASSASASAAAVKAGAAEVEEVAIRLTEQLGAATVELPNLQRGLAELQTHWRRMQAPWKDTARQSNGRLVQLVAVRTSQSEVAHVITTSDGGTQTFDVKKWNTAEGSYAQREAIVAPTPSTLRFRLRVPLHAALEIAPAVLAIGEGGPHGPAGEVTFRARAVPVGGGDPIEIGKVVVLDRDRWNEQRFSLAALAGKEVDLELLADAAPKAGSPAGLPTPMVLALWGTPRIVKKAPARLPYNVLWIVVDSLRPDVIPSFHDPAVDAAKAAAKMPPGDTWLPVVPGLTPHLDALAKRGVVYRNAISGAPWTRPGTLAMLAGLHSREVGLSPLPWSLVDAQLDAYYRAEPPLVSLAFRRAGAATRAIVNNNFMLGYASVGADMGFEHVEDFRYRTADTAAITKTAIDTLRAHAGERFFHFVNYNSPHEPFEPPRECLERVPGAIKAKPKKSGPSDSTDEEKKAPAVDPIKAYMAEACKDDAAIGELLAALDELHLRQNTLVLVTADHGETLSERHEGIAVDLDGVNTRFHHAFGMWEETTRIPILLSLPGVIPEGKAVDGRVSNLDLVPTLLALEGLEKDPRLQGLDLIGPARGAPLHERPIVTLGRASAAVFWGKYRFVQRDREAQKWSVGKGDDRETLTITHELYDLVDDPGETKNLASNPAFFGLVDEMRGRLKAALAGVPTADVVVAEPSGAAPKLLFRFSGGGAPHRVHVTIRANGATRFEAKPFGLAPEAVRVSQTSLDLAANTAADALVGVDLIVEPAATPLTWTFDFDDKPLADDAVFGGVLGVVTPGLAKGLPDASARASIAAPALPFIDPALDRGVFVVRVGAADNAPERTTGSGAAAAEVKSALQQWGYAK